MGRTTIGRVVLLVAVAGAACSGEQEAGSGDAPTGARGPQSNLVEEASTAEVLKMADRAMRALDDVVYEGTLSVPIYDRTIEGPGRIAIVDRETCELTLRPQRLGELTVRLVDGRAYLKANPKWWTAMRMPDTTIPELAGKWLVLPVETSPIGDDCYLGSLATAADVERCFDGLETSDVERTPARIIRCGASGGGTHTMYVAMVGEPLVLRRVGLDADAPFDVMLVDTNTGATINLPPKDEILDPHTRSA